MIEQPHAQHAHEPLQSEVIRLVTRRLRDR